jgi:hypothetical protein
VLRGKANGIGSGAKFGMPALEVASQLLIEHTGSDLQQPMCAVRCPPHLLLLYEPLADYLVDGRLDKAGRDGLAVPVTVGDRRTPRYPPPVRILAGHRRSACTSTAAAV